MWLSLVAVCPNCPATVTIQMTVRSQPYSEAELEILFHFVTNLFHFAGPLDWNSAAIQTDNWNLLRLFAKHCMFV